MSEPQSYNVAERAAYSPVEFGKLFGKSKSWTYRLLYSGKLQAVTSVGHILIPASERDRILAEARSYDPQQESAPNDAEVAT